MRYAFSVQPTDHQLPRVEVNLATERGAVLVGTIENFAVVLMARLTLGVAANATIRLGIALKHFERVLQKRLDAIDGAFCAFFLGRRIETRSRTTRLTLVMLGVEHLRHVDACSVS